MKTLKITILLGLISFTTYSQSFTFMDNSYEEKGQTMVKLIGASEVIERSGSAKELQEDMTQWVHFAYRNPYAVINLERDGYLRIKGGCKRFVQPDVTETELNCTYFLGFRFKDGSFKVELEDLFVIKDGEIHTFPVIIIAKKKGKPNELGIKLTNSFQKGFDELLESMKSYETSAKDN